MPKPGRIPKVILSDDPLRPTDVLPRKVTLALDGDPETENPYNPIPKRPDEPDEPPGKRRPDDDPEEPFDEPDEPDEDAPPPAQPGDTPAAAGVAVPPPPVMGSEYSAPVPTTGSHAPLPQVVTYRSRISVLQAWRYPGQLAQAPAFIDRAWTAWVDADIYGRPAGPALKIPVSRTISGPTPADGFKFCRIGDYVVRQNVTLVDGLEPEESLDVWPKDDFERLFLPVREPHADAA